MRERCATLDGINLHEGVLGLDDDNVLTNQNASWGVQVHRLLSSGEGREKMADKIGVIFNLSLSLLFFFVCFFRAKTTTTNVLVVVVVCAS